MRTYTLKEFRNLTTNITFFPVMVVGEVGSGKTHLLKELCQAHSGAVYVNAYTLGNTICRAVAQENPRLLHPYTNAPLLAVDNLELLAGREEIQKSVISLLQTLQGQGGAMVLASASHNRLNGFLEGMEKAFPQFTVVNMETPTQQELTAYALQEFQKRNLPVPLAAVTLLGQKAKHYRHVNGIVANAELAHTLGQTIDKHWMVRQLSLLD